MKSIRKSRNRFIVLSLAIPVILLLMFVVYPSVDLVAMSFTSWDGISPHRDFVDVGNYVDMFTKSPDLWLSLRNNFIYLAVHMVMIPIELSIAVMLNTKFKGAGLVKTIAFLPFIINGVGMSYAFSYFFSPVNGAFNDILTSLGLSSWIQSWLSDPKVVNFVLASVSAWRFSGYHIVLFSTGLTSIPTEVMEAARIDGMNEVGIFFRIMLPLCKAAMLSLAVFTMMGNWNDLLYPLMLTTTTEMRTLPSGLAMFVGERVTQYGPSIAGSVISMLPLLLMYCFAQKYFIAGIAMSGMKD